MNEGASGRMQPPLALVGSPASARSPWERAMACSWRCRSTSTADERAWLVGAAYGARIERPVGMPQQTW